MKTWILIGMMGSGKSVVGRHLANLSGRDYMDTDQLLERRFGRPVHAIFATYGEEAFRGHETNILRSIEPGPFVLSTGGGVVIREENWIEMRRLGVVIFLDVDPAILKKRLATSKRKRPLLQTENWEERFESILSARRSHYERADHCIPVHWEDAVEVARTIFERLQAE